MKRNHLFLPGIWLVLGLLIAGLSNQHPTHATSPDSLHYLRLATDWRSYDGVFPPGYSLLIRLLSGLTNLPGLWASKLVNWLALGYFGWAWAKRVGAKRAAWMLAIWLLPGNLRIVTYTWSETVFMVLLLDLIWHLHHFFVDQSRKNEWRVVGLLVALVWVRYVGLFLGLMLVGYVTFCHPDEGGSLQANQSRSSLLRRDDKNRVAGWYFFCLGIATLLIVNLFLTGYFFGGPRLLPTEPWPNLLEMFGVACLNEVLLYDFRPDRSLELVVIIAMGQAVMVISVGWWLRRRVFRQGVEFVETPLVRWLFGVGAAYFLTLFVLRTISPFDPLNERLMAPGSVCWLLGLVLFVQSQHSIRSKSPDRAETFTNPS
jgi:hypothetical protein